MSLIPPCLRVREIRAYVRVVHESTVTLLYPLRLPLPLVGGRLIPTSGRQSSREDLPV